MLSISFPKWQRAELDLHLLPVVDKPVHKNVHHRLLVSQHVITQRLVRGGHCALQAERDLDGVVVSIAHSLVATRHNTTALCTALGIPQSTEVEANCAGVEGLVADGIPFCEA